MDLTKRQAQIVEQLAAGLTADEIAARFCRSAHTVRTQIKQACQRVGARNIANLVAISIKNGFIHLVCVLLITSMIVPADDALRTARRPVRRQDEYAVIV